MAISLTEIPKNLMRPVVAFEIRGTSIVGISAEDYRPLAIVEKLTSGSGQDKKIYLVSSEDEAKKLFGENSAGHIFYNSYVKNNGSLLHMMPISNTDDIKYPLSKIKVKDVAKISDGRIELSVFGRTINVFIDTSRYEDKEEFPSEEEVKADVAGKIAEELKDLKNIPISVTDEENGTSVVVTSTTFSLSTGVIPIEIGYNDTGVELGLASENDNVKDAVEYDVTDALDAIGEEIFDFVCLPYSDKKNLKVARDWAEERRLALNALDGQCLAIRNIPVDLLLEVKKYQQELQSETITLFANQGKESEPEILGAIVGQIAKSALNNPARPFQNKELIGITPVDSLFSKDNRQFLLQYGISTFLKSGSRLSFERVMTLAEETSRFRDLNDALTIVMLRRDLVRFIKSKYPDYNITAMDSNLPNTLSLSTFKVDYRGRYQYWVEQGLVDILDMSEFQNIKAEKINDGIKVELPVKLLDQLRIVVGRINAI